MRTLGHLGIAGRTALALIAFAALLLSVGGWLESRSRLDAERVLLEERAAIVADVVARAVVKTMAEDRPHDLAHVLDAMASAQGMSGVAVGLSDGSERFSSGEVPAVLEPRAGARWDGGRLSLTRVLPAHAGCGDCHTGASAALLYVGLDLGPAAARARSFALRLAVGLAVAVLLTAAATVLVVRHYVSAPLRRLEAFATQLSAGDFEARPPEEDWPETRQLSQALSAMAERVQRSHHELVHRVDERTARAVNAERLASLGLMSAQLAHELRNPLNAVGGALQYLRRVLGKEQPMAEYAPLMEEELARMNRFIDDLLRVARPAPPALSEVEPEELVHSAVRTTTLGRGTNLDAVLCTFAAALPRLHVDRRMIQEALMNLLENALDAGGGGKVEVHVRVEPSEEGPEVVLEVKDRGTGLVPELADRLGRPFVSSKPRGTGLGLVIVRHAAGQHGGAFRLAAREGGGAVATLRFPVRSASPVQATEEEVKAA